MSGICDDCSSPRMHANSPRGMHVMSQICSRGVATQSCPSDLVRLFQLLLRLTGPTALHFQRALFSKLPRHSLPVQIVVLRFPLCKPSYHCPNPNFPLFRHGPEVVHLLSPFSFYNTFSHSRKTPSNESHRRLRQ